MEAIAIAIHLHEVVPNMAEQQNTVLLPYVEARVEVELRHSHGVAKQVEIQFFAMILLGFLVFHVNLSADRLVAVTHR